MSDPLFGRSHCGIKKIKEPMDNQERAQASYSTLNFMVLEDDPELDRSVE